MYKKEILLIIKKFLMIILLLVSLDFLIGLGLDNRLKKAPIQNTYGKINYAIDKIKDSTIIMGSSRALHHYVPSLLSDKYSTSCFNMGFDGQSLIFQYGIFKLILKHHTPKTVIWDLFPVDVVSYNQQDYDKLSVFAPYYGKHDEIDDLILKKGYFEQIKLFSSAYRYNSISSLILLNSFRKSDFNSFSCGYIPLNGKMLNSDNKVEYNLIKIDHFKLNLLKNIISICKRKTINLIFCFSPDYINNENVSLNQASQIITKIMQENKVTYIDSKNWNNHFSNKNLFKDPIHLNHEGAEIYSKLLYDTLSKISK